MRPETKVIFEYLGSTGLRRVVGWRGPDWEVRIIYKFLEKFQ